MKFLRCRERALPECWALGTELHRLAAREGQVFVSASVVRGPALVFGAHQRANRVVDMDACSRGGIALFRRNTAGTAVFIAERALVWTLALPRIDALADDARPGTLLNRNVRGFLKGLTRVGSPAHYFGREWIALHHRPGAVLGFDVSEEGAVLIELIAGYESPAALPRDVITAAERDVDRWLGKEPISLLEAFGTKRTPEDLGNIVAEACATRWSTTLEPIATVDLPLGVDSIVRHGDDPIPSGFQPLRAQRCAIGWIDVAIARDPEGTRVSAWLGGDVLAPRWALDRIAERALADSLDDIDWDALPLLGARREEFASIAWR